MCIWMMDGKDRALQIFACWKLQIFYARKNLFKVRIFFLNKLNYIW